MSHIPQELKYSTTHEWIRDEGDDEYTVGITDHAQTLLGDLVYIELPAIESELGADEEAGVVESVKAASDIFSPIAGEVIEVNEALAESPGLVNEDPYGKGWLLRIRALHEDALMDLLDAKAYAKLITSEAH